MSVQPQQNLTSTWLKVRCRHHHFFHSVQVKDICEEDCYIWKQHCHLNVFLRFVLFFFPWEGWISGASKRCGGSWNLGVSGILTRHCFFFFFPSTSCWRGHWVEAGTVTWTVRGEFCGVSSQLLKSASAVDSMTHIPRPCLTTSPQIEVEFVSAALCKADWPSQFTLSKNNILL